MEFNKGAEAVAAKFSTLCASLMTDKFSSKIVLKKPGYRQCSSPSKSRNIFMWETERCWLDEW